MPTHPSDPQNTPADSAELPPFRVRTRPATRLPESPKEKDKKQSATKPNTQERSYVVGYGKPPVSTRFKPGQSGNPKGRPKAAKSLRTIVRELLTQKVMVRTASGERRITRIEAILLKKIERAMQGSGQELTHLPKLYDDAVPEQKSHPEQQKPAEETTATDLAMLEELRLLLLAAEEGDDDTSS